MSLSETERRYLFRVARESIAHAAQGHEPLPIDLEAVPERLQRDGASFVTLNKRGRLRGCIGSLEASGPLILDVQENAVGAALRDPRFPPVRPEEVDELAIEISVLTLPERLHYDSVDELFNELRPGVDGVVIECGWQRATFLPQVWDKLPDKEQFLERLCLKAGLAPEAYRGQDLDVWTYRVEKLQEE